MAANQQTQSPLFHLPAELRNRIYEHVSIIHESNDEPNIFRTCRKIRNEGLKLFYATHIFFFAAEIRFHRRWEATNYQHFLTSIGAEKVAMIEHLRFDISDENARYSKQPALDVSMNVVLDPEKVLVAQAEFSRSDITKETMEALGNAMRNLNGAWAAHGNPTKAGLLRTLPALVRGDIKIEQTEEAG